MKILFTVLPLRLALGLLLFALGTLPRPAFSAGSSGTDFWLAFPYNVGNPHTLTIYIAATAATTGVVAVPGLGFSVPFAVPAGGLMSVIVPSTAQLSSTLDEATENLGVHVTSLGPVTVYGLNRSLATTDAYLALPVASLGLSYRVMAYSNVVSLAGSEAAVVATQNGTTLTIVPSSAVAGHPAGVPYNIVLNQGQTYQLVQNNSIGLDLTGTLINADKPVSVFGGHACANVPAGVSYCDFIVEQMFPLDTWGKNFVTLPLATRAAGDIFRILASTAGTVVTINGVPQAPLAAGAFIEVSLSSASVIQADQPVLVAQYCKGTAADGVPSDPFEMLIPPYEQFSADYIVTTPPSGFSANYVNVVVPSAALGMVTLNGTPISAGLFSPIGASGFFGAMVPLSLGPHRLTAPLPFGAFVYGFGTDDSYGYPGGTELSSIALLQNLTLTPKTGLQLVGSPHCVTATVTDGGNSPIASVRVDFSVNGAHTLSGFAYSNALGQAVYCYLGSAAGSDVIRASMGSLSDTAACDWIIYTPTITPTWSISPTSTPSPTITLTSTHTSTRSPTPTFTPSATSSATVTFTGTRTLTPSSTQTSTWTSTPTNTVTPSITPTWSNSPTWTPSPTITPTWTISQTFTPSPTPIDQPGVLAVRCVYPNPFVEEATFCIVSKRPGRLAMQAYNVAGEIIATRSADIPLGSSAYTWDGRNDSGARCASGIYLVRMILAVPEGGESQDFIYVAVAR